MPHYGRYLRHTAAALFLFLPISATTENLFTGTFMSDRRPNEMIFLSLTQVEKDVSGYMVVVTAANRGKTESVTLNLDGIADNQTVSLHTKRLLSDLYLSGYKEKGQIRLTIPNSTGSLTTSHLIPATHSEYSEKLSAWKQTHADIYNEQSRILKFSTDIKELLDNIQNTKIPEQLETAQRLLVRQQENHAVLDKKRERFKELFKHDQATQCDYLHSKISPFFHDELSGYFHDSITGVSISLRQTIKDIKTRIENGRETLTEVKLKVSELKEALAHRKYPLPTELPKLPTDGQTLIDDYASLTDAATKEVGIINGEYNPIASKVKEIMRRSEYELHQQGSSCI